MRKTIIIKILLVVLVTATGSADAADAVQLEELSSPTRIVVGTDRLFVIDSPAILIYSAEDYSLISKFGREGEGPGEFKGFISYMEVHGDEILAYSNGRLSWFTVEGKFVKQRSEATIGVNYKIAGSGYVGMRLIRESDGIYFGISLFDAALKSKREFHRFRHPFFGKRQRGTVDASDVRFSSYHVWENRIYVDKPDGCIHVYDLKGENISRICPEIKKVSVTPAHKKRYLDFWRTDLKMEYQTFGKRLVFPSHFPLIRDFRVTDGKIYVFTYSEKDQHSELLVMDLGGTFIKRLWAPMQDVNPLLPHLFSFYTIKNNRLYILRDNEETETWELRTVELQ